MRSGNRTLLDWVYSRVEPVSQWISPPGRRKSALLNSYLQPGHPTLILFTKRNPYLQPTPYTALVSQPQIYPKL